jgi:hypothetical protein
MSEIQPPHWVCIDCGHRQAEKGPCAACAKDDTSDLRDDKIRELMRDVEGRLSRQREGRLRFLGVIVGMAAVFGLWFIPGYWDYRAQFLALPAFFDQWLLMALIGFGVAVLLGRAFDKKRFPYLADDLTIR